MPSLLKTTFFVKLVLPALALLLAAACSHEEDYSNSHMYGVKATGNRVNNNGNNSAAVQLTGSYNALTNSFTYNIAWKNLTTAPIGGGIYHANAIPAAGNELIAWQLSPAGPTSGEWHSFIRLDSSTAAKLIRDSLQFVIRTSQFPHGKFNGRLDAFLQYP